MKKQEWSDKMSALEAQGLTRAAIAQRLSVTPAYVTQILGPRKKYRPRIKQTEEIK